MHVHSKFKGARQPQPQQPIPSPFPSPLPACAASLPSCRTGSDIFEPARARASRGARVFLHRGFVIHPLLLLSLPDSLLLLLCCVTFGPARRPAAGRCRRCEWLGYNSDPFMALERPPSPPRHMSFMAAHLRASRMRSERRVEGRAARASRTSRPAARGVTRRDPRGCEDLDVCLQQERIYIRPVNKGVSDMLKDRIYAFVGGPNVGLPLLQAPRRSDRKRPRNTRVGEAGAERTELRRGMRGGRIGVGAPAVPCGGGALRCPPACLLLAPPWRHGAAHRRLDATSGGARSGCSPKTRS